jgi:hypothetical protein
MTVMGYYHNSHPHASCKLLFWVLLWMVGLRPAPAHPHGFEPWLAPEPLYERVGLLPTAAALSHEIDKARRQVEWCQVALGETHPGTAQAQAHLGELLFLHWAPGHDGAEGDAAAPSVVEEAAAEEALRRARALLPGGARARRGPVLFSLAVLHELRGQREEADALFREAEQEHAPPQQALRIEVAAALRLQRAGGAAGLGLDPGPGGTTGPAGIERAEAILRRRCEAPAFALGPGPGLRQAAALHELRASLLAAMGRPAEAEALARRVAQALEQGAQPGPGLSEREQDDLSAALGNLALLLHRGGRDGEAEALLSRALQIRLRLLGERDPRTSRSARNLAALLWRTGQLARAEAPLLLSLRAWPIQSGQPGAQPAAPQDAREAAVGLLWLGALYQAQRAHAPRAEAALRAAWRLGQQAAPDAALSAQALLAELLLAQGRLREAAAQADALLAARRRPGADPGALLQAVALRAAIEEQRGDRAAAAALLQRALDTAAGKSAGPLSVLLRGQLGRALLGREKEQALASRVAVAGPIQGPPPLNLPLEGQGPGPGGPLGEESVGQALDALAAHALSLLPVAPSPTLDSGVRATTAALVGTLLAAAERPLVISRQTASALLRALDAPALSSALAEALGGAQAPGERGRLWRLMRQRADLLLDPTPRPWAERQARTWQLAEAIRAAEEAAGPAHAPLDALLRRREWDAVQIEQALSQRDQEGALLVLLRGVVPPAGPASPGSAHEAGPAPAAPVILHRNGRPLPPLRGPTGDPVTGAAISQAAQPAQARDHYGALLLRPGREARLFDLGEAAAVDEAADRLLRLAEAQRDPGPALRSLGQRLITPIEPALGKGERLFVLLPPALSALPLSALPLSNGQPLCAHGPVQALDSLDALLLGPPGAGAAAEAKARGADAERRLRHMLLLGAPTLRDDVLAGLLAGLRTGLPAHDTETLALAPAEMTEVGALLRAHRYDPRGGPVLGLAATRTRLQAWLPSQVVHLLAPILLPGGGGDAAPVPMLHRAALPFLSLIAPAPDGPRRAAGAGPAPVPVNDQGPARQGLALASFYQQEPDLRLDEGLVGPDELARLDLRDTALLVLSGPVVASSARGAGMGLAALRQAARRAGTREVLATLWRPQEAQARDLMLRFYAAWLRSGDAADAVRQVQVEAHRRGEPPLLWAGLSAGR